MKALQRTSLTITLAIALALPSTALLAADPPAVDPHAGHGPAAAPSEVAPDPMVSMRERMQQIRQTSDPEIRRALMDAQMKDMETLMQRPAASCPKADGMAGKCGGKAMMGGMGGKCGSMADKCGGKSMKGAMTGGKCGMSDDMLHRRMDMMEKRMDMMQMMMQNRMGQSMPGK